MIRKYIYCLFLIFAPLFVSAQNTEKEQQKENSKNEGFNELENFLKPYREKLEEISKQKPKIANTSNFTVEERNTYLRHFLLEKKAKNDIELAKFTFIEQNKNNDYTQILVAEKLNGGFEEVNYNLLETFYKGLNQNDKNSENGKKLASFLKEYEQVQIGFKVPDFSLPDVNKKTKTLYKNLGKYTIIDFWASWCGPCRQENPSTVALYNKYQKKGLKIIGISLDTDEHKWIGAIQKDNLTWLQLSNLIGWKEPLLQNFKVTSIPKLIILDKKGTIIAKDLRGEELAKKIEELFTKK
ncbi:MAG: TlpA disulfide reductase family protein [Myroides sp.]